GQPAREKNSDEDRCDDRKRMTVSCHYDGEQDRERGNKNHKAERAGHRFDLRCASAAWSGSGPVRSMFALPRKADMCGATRDVRFGPIADILLIRPLHRWSQEMRVKR